jgi:hypothetical protein
MAAAAGGTEFNYLPPLQRYTVKGAPRCTGARCGTEVKPAGAPYKLYQEKQCASVCAEGSETLCAECVQRQKKHFETNSVVSSGWHGYYLSAKPNNSRMIGSKRTIDELKIFAKHAGVDIATAIRIASAAPPAAVEKRVAKKEKEVVVAKAKVATKAVKRATDAIKAAEAAAEAAEKRKKETAARAAELVAVAMREADKVKALAASSASSASSASAAYSAPSAAATSAAYSAPVPVRRRSSSRNSRKSSKSRKSSRSSRNSRKSNRAVYEPVSRANANIPGVEVNARNASNASRSSGNASNSNEVPPLDG